jgi:hypothetical protein
MLTFEFYSYDRSTFSTRHQHYKTRRRHYRPDRCWAVDIFVDGKMRNRITNLPSLAACRESAKGLLHRNAKS